MSKQTITVADAYTRLQDAEFAAKVASGEIKLTYGNMPDVYGIKTDGLGHYLLRDMDGDWIVTLYGRNPLTITRNPPAPQADLLYDQPQRELEQHYQDYVANMEAAGLGHLIRDYREWFFHQPEYKLRKNGVAEAQRDALVEAAEALAAIWRAWMDYRDCDDTISIAFPDWLIATYRTNLYERFASMAEALDGVHEPKRKEDALEND